MAHGHMRPLTAGEVVLARQAFGDRIDYSRIRLCYGAAGNPVAALAFRNGNPAITLRQTIFFGRCPAQDYSFASPSLQALFVHEMAHVWQFAELGLVRFLLRYARDLASCRFHAPAMYRYEPGVTRFAGAMLEAQAQMIGDYWLARLTSTADRAAAIGRSLSRSGLYGL